MTTQASLATSSEMNFLHKLEVISHSSCLLTTALGREPPHLLRLKQVRVNLYHLVLLVFASALSLLLRFLCHVMMNGRNGPSQCRFYPLLAHIEHLLTLRHYYAFSNRKVVFGVVVYQRPLIGICHDTHLSLDQCL